jgi:regulator-associated protein of mTOR
MLLLTQLVSAGIRGYVYISDPRYPKDVPKKFRAHLDSPLNTMVVHNYAPLIATGSSKQFVNVMKMDGTIINKIRHHDGFLGQRIASVHCLAFHPNKLLLAAGGKDSYVSIMQSTTSFLK